MSVGYSLPERHPLRARRDGVAGVFDVGAGDVGARGGEEAAADVEVGVGAVGG